MNGQPTILSHERIELDQLEVQLYGTSSTQIYLMFREMVDKEIKLAMLKITNYFEENAMHNQDLITKVLGEKYLEFYTQAEPILQNFYQEIQDILKLPDNVSLFDKCVTAEKAFDKSEVSILEKEIADLEKRCIIEKYHLEILKQTEMLINNVNLTSKEIMKSQTNRQNSIKASSTVNPVLDEKIKKYIDDMSKDDLKKAINSDIELIDNN
ncbi:hypothetical protein HUJ04_010814 [Dendroctonus ponderosae]|uniref:Protein MIS12 homolog n=1 Tax=Dendroctonus ponderosae TaxID=77166 RepID=A0AAR5P093_DENPD|nr:hypothetical protein HUJ04_010814 [Dendroctonus ponderosae]